MELLKNLEGMSADEQMSAVVELQKAAMKTLEEQKQVSIGKSAEMVVQGLKKIKSDFEAKFDSLNYDIQTKVSNLKDGQQGIQGQKGEQGDRGLDGAQGRDGRNGLDGKNGVDGEDGVSVEDAKIDFDGSLIITLSTGREMNVGEVVAPDLAERIKVISTMSTNTAIANITSGTIDGTVIGGSTPAAGTFTTATVTTGNITTVNATTVDATNVEVTNIKAKDGTASISLADSTGIASFSKATVISTSDTTAALRVTQLGTGNALLVEDSTNPDSTPVVINSSGSVVIGNTSTIDSPDSSGNQRPFGLSLVGESFATTGFLQASYITSSAAQATNFAKARGGIASPSIVLNNDGLMALQAVGFDGTNFIRAASISAAVDGTPGTSDMPGRLVFNTTADGASTPTERMRISSTGQTTLSGNTIISTTDNTNAALRITQLGTGNALLVEDTTNPDATPFVIDASGNVVRGNATPLNTPGLASTTGLTPALQSHGTSNSGSAVAAFGWSATGSTSPQYILSRSRGASAGTFGVVSSGDNLGGLTFNGDDGTAFIRAANIVAQVDGTPGTNDMPGRLLLSTTPDGSDTPVERVRIDSAGRLRQFGDTILSNVNVIGASYDSVSFSVAGEETSPQDLFFSPDGLKMYVIGSTGDDVNEYNLSTAWVVSSAIYSTVFSVSGQDSAPAGLFFRADGTKMYVVGQANDTVFQYTLSTPWSVATASYDSISFSIAAQETTPSAVFFKPNGLSMYVTGSTGDAVYQYTLSTAWNVSTATFLQSFSVSGQESAPNGLFFTGDGSRMFVMGITGDDVNVYNLTTPWDISTSAFVNVFSVSSQETAPTGIYIKPDGTKMYIVGSINDTVYQYTVPSIDIQLTGTTSVAALEVQQDLNIYGKLGAYSISASNVGVGTSSPSASAILDAQSTTKGVRMPNMTTTQKNAIASPAAGLMVFDTTLAKLSVYSGVAWETITSI